VLPPAAPPGRSTGTGTPSDGAPAEDTTGGSPARATSAPDATTGSGATQGALLLPEVGPSTPGEDPAQEFVTRLRSAAAEFAAAAGAESAVVREAVPPARHRRSRCRVVLRTADGEETDLVFLGSAARPAGAPATTSDLAGGIRAWLAAGQPRGGAWVVEDEDAPGATAVDVATWTSQCSTGTPAS
jgi:hypothetical protein